MELRVMSVDEVREASRTVPAEYQRVLATDADGTLWEGDVGDALFRHMARAGALTREGQHAVTTSCARHLRDVPETLAAQVDALIAGHAEGRVPIEDLCDLEAICAGGRSRAAFDALLRDVAGTFVERLRPESMRLITALRREGFAVHVVTASLAALVEATLAAAGVPVDRVSGGVLRTDRDEVLESLAGPIPMHGAKVDSLRVAGHWPAAVGMGDGGWDATFLRGCALPLLVHPKPALLAAMKEHPRVARLSAMQ